MLDEDKYEYLEIVRVLKNDSRVWSTFDSACVLC